MAASAAPPIAEPRRLAFFERYLTLWVALCMAVGVVLGTLLPSAVRTLRSLEFGQGNQIDAPIAVSTSQAASSGRGPNWFEQALLPRLAPVGCWPSWRLLCSSSVSEALK